MIHRRDPFVAAFELPLTRLSLSTALRGDWFALSKKAADWSVYVSVNVITTPIGRWARFPNSRARPSHLEGGAYLLAAGVGWAVVCGGKSTFKKYNKLLFQKWEPETTNTTICSKVISPANADECLGVVLFVEVRRQRSEEVH